MSTTQPDETRPWNPAEIVSLLDTAGGLIEQAGDLLRRIPEEPSAPARTPAQSGAADLPAALLDAVAASERLRSLADATQMRASVAFRDSRMDQQRRQGLPRAAIGKGVSNELALARHASPARTANQLAVDRVIVETLPSTMDLLARGEISKWSADEVAKAVVCLDDEDRAVVDSELAARLPEVSPRRAGGLARARADELDQQAALARNAREVSQRCVSIRPVSDAIVRVSALLPMVEGVAAYRALDQAASSARAQGIAGTRGQHMADALFQRVTGLARPEDVSIEIQLLMTDECLLAGSVDAAWIDGHPMPGAVARRLALAEGHGTMSAGGATGEPVGGPAAVADASDASDDDPTKAAPMGVEAQGNAAAARFIRRLYTDPVSGCLRESDARRRRFTGPERRFVEISDQHCRTPWCDAPIRHIDHVRSFADGGTTETSNGAGRCEGCNYLMEQAGWSARFESPPREALTPSPPGGPPPRPPSPHEIPGPERTLAMTTPMGRTYTSSAPPLRRAPVPALLASGTSAREHRDQSTMDWDPHPSWLDEPDASDEADPATDELVEDVEDPMSDAMFEEMLAYFADHPERSVFDGKRTVADRVVSSA